jgi:hypothetical protein
MDWKGCEAGRDPLCDTILEFSVGTKEIHEESQSGELVSRTETWTWGLSTGQKECKTNTVQMLMCGFGQMYP